MRGIVRISITGEQNGALRNKLAGICGKYGFRTGPGGTSTGTWQNSNIDKADIAAFQAEYWQTVAEHSGPGELDNFWCTIDTWPHPQGHDEKLEAELEKLGIIEAKS